MITLERGPNKTEDGEEAAPSWLIQCPRCGEKVYLLTKQRPSDDSRPCLMCRRADALGYDVR